MLYKRKKDMKYYLMNKDNRIGTFDLENDTVKNASLEINPFNMFSNLGEFLNKRKAINNNNMLKKLLSSYNANNLEGFLSITHALGINDCIWVLREDEHLRWKNINLYDNKFNEMIEKFAFLGYGATVDVPSATPSLTSDGTFPRCFKQEGNKIYLYKRGDIGGIHAANSGLEPYSEILSSKVMHALNSNSIVYEKAYNEGKVASKCKIFTSQKVGYIPYSKIGTEFNFDKILSFYDKYEEADKLKEMMVYDTVILNEDRHLGNFGILIDNDNFNILGMAPLFDFNISLGTYIKNLDDMEEMNALISKSGEDFFSLANRFLTHDIRDSLERYIEEDKDLLMRYEDVCDDTFPVKRLYKINSIVNKNIEGILSQKTNILSVYPSEKIKKEQEEVKARKSRKVLMTPSAYTLLDYMDREGYITSLIEDDYNLTVIIESEDGKKEYDFDFLNGKIRLSNIMGETLTIKEKDKDFIINTLEDAGLDVSDFELESNSAQIQ